MRLKITIFLILANIVTLATIWKLERDRELTPLVAAPLFAPDMREITVDAQGATQYAIEKHPHGWRLTSPFVWEANNTAVDRIVEQLNFIKLDGSFTVAEARANGSSLSNYGLEKPDASISVRGNGTAPPTVIRLGRPSGANAASAVYLLAPDERIIPLRVSEAQAFLASLMVAPEALRAETIFTIGSFEVRNITVRVASGGTGGEHVRIKRDQRPIHGQNDTERVWRFEIPVNADASRVLVDAHLDALSQLRYLRFLTPTAEASAELLQQTGLSNPELRITLEGNNRLQTLLVGARDATATEPARFAKLEDNRAIFTVREADVEIWRDAKGALREREFFQFTPSLLTEITVRNHERTLVFHRRPSSSEATAPTPATAPTGTAARPEKAGEESGDWTLSVLSDSTGASGKATLAADPGVMHTFIAAAGHLRADAFVTDAPTEAQLSALGFNTPVRRVELGFKNGIRRTLLIAGATAEGAPLHAKLADQPTVYAVQPEVLELFSVLPAQYRNRLVEQVPAGGAVAGVKIVDLASEKTLLAVSRPAATSTWSAALTAIDPVERAAVFRLVGLLDVVRAAGFVDEDDGAFKEKYEVRHLNARNAEGWRYQLDITVRTQSDGTETTRTFYLTKRLGATTQIAGSPAQNCIFQLEQPLIDALHPLTFGRDSSRELPTIAQPPALPPPPATAPTPVTPPTAPTPATAPAAP
ncbi:MAG: DUF4340 domain-containing protein [Puniceicoccales bacterium]|jgi:hypothetical protein|nr:DUF4340 domain-containing protein [Puniceicoccales bacterium]